MARDNTHPPVSLGVAWLLSPWLPPLRLMHMRREEVIDFGAPVIGYDLVR
jgi:hypothetical protein